MSTLAALRDGNRRAARQRVPRMTLKVGSLFSGYGGLDLAVEVVTGATPAWFVEFDAAPSRILAHHWPDVPNLGDITTVDWASVEPVDILTGGFPCQDLSHAGKRAGLRPGTRSGLWEHMAYAIDQLRPRLVVAENVRGLLSATADSDLEPCPWCVGGSADGEPVLRALGAVLGDLADIGYDAEWYGLRAADVGAPHGRFRVFVVAYPQGHPWRFSDGDGGAAADPDGAGRGEPRRTEPVRAQHAPAEHPGPEAGRGRLVGVGPQAPQPIALATEVGSEVAGVSVDLGVDQEESLGFEGHDVTMPALAADLSSLLLLPTPLATDGTKMTQSEESAARRTALGRQPSITDVALTALLPTPKASDGTNGGPGMRNGRGQVDALPAAAALLPTPLATDAKESGGGYNGQANVTLTDATARGRVEFGAYARAIARWEDVLGRPAPAPTEEHPRTGRPRLSPEFVEWMMGLPAGHVTDPAIGLSYGAQLKALGNGVVPQQAAAALQLMLGGAS